MRELSEWFTGAAAKRLSDVEVDPGRSNQHEFQATQLVRRFMGETADKVTIAARFVYLSDGAEPVVTDSTVTYYDARARQPTRSAEYRLYYPDTEVTSQARSGDVLVFAMRRDGTCLVVIARAESTAASQVLWLFDIGLGGGLGFSFAEVEAFAGALTSVDAVVMLELFGIDAELDSAEDVELIRARFGTTFPTTLAFSALAREVAGAPDPRNDPDGALLAWWDTEFRLFQAFERGIVEERLAAGFEGSSAVDDFLKFSLSVQNRRKSRSGHALENHVAAVLSANHVRFTQQAITERGSKPDFLLPSQDAYDSPQFPAEQLHMLGAKTTAKDRWRQILSEADRVRRKHLITLEPAISVPQTDEMDALGVQLVVPRQVHSSYSDVQQNWLWTLADFIHTAVQSGDTGQ